MTTHAGQAGHPAPPPDAQAATHGALSTAAREMTLRQALDAARATFARELPPASLQARVRSAAAAAQGRRPRPDAVVAVRGGAPGRSGPGAWAWPAAAAVAVALPLAVAMTLALPPPTPTGDGAAHGGAPSSGFVPVAGPEVLRLAATPEMPAWVVSTELPRERLGLLGLPYDPARAAETVRAELLLHGSGAVLAVRLVTP